MDSHRTVVVVGGGAAGFFAAVTAAKTNPKAEVVLLEKTQAPLAKVRLSGGGRCNVTHYCFDPKELAKNYPRGQKALLGPFSRFQPRDTIDWFETRGVPLKVEEDGRLFPCTNQSQTIVDCLMREATCCGVKVMLKQGVKNLTKEGDLFCLSLSAGDTLRCHRVILATGGSRDGFELARLLGHTIILPVPSLFTFHIPDSPFHALAGVSVQEVEVGLEGTTLVQSGPLLITHWGFSGPAILKLSAWGARLLHERNYTSQVNINWLPDLSLEKVRDQLLELKKKHPERTILHQDLWSLPRQIWRVFVELQQINPQQRLRDIPHKQLTQLAEKLKKDSYRMEGKSIHKQEFVTCGGVCLDEVHFKTFESRLCPGLFFAGEVLDIDGVTGGFNFQNAWTSGWIAGQSAVI